MGSSTAGGSSVISAGAAALRWLEPWTITGGWSGGVARRSADPLAQIGQLRSQGVELLAELIVLLLLSQDQRSDAGWSRQPVHF